MEKHTHPRILPVEQHPRRPSFDEHLHCSPSSRVPPNSTQTSEPIFRNEFPVINLQSTGNRDLASSQPNINTSNVTLHTSPASQVQPWLRRSPRKHGMSPKQNRSNAEPTTSSLPHQSQNHGRTSSQQVQPTETTQTQPTGPFSACVFEESDRLARVHTYVKLLKVKELQQISKQWNLRQRNRSKRELVARILLHIYLQNSNGVSLGKLLEENNYLKSFTLWEEEAIQQFWTWDILPEVQTCLTMVNPAERNSLTRAIKEVLKAKSGENDASPRPNFCLNEFARLMVLLRDDERCKYLLEATQKELTRGQLDARVTRESFWAGISARFNDSGVDSREDFTGFIEELDSNQRPLCERGATVLKNQFFSAKKDFTKVYHNWSASGQNDPDRILRFLTYTGSGDLTVDSKRALILFIVCRVGKPNGDTDLLRAATKLIESRTGGRDEGVGAVREYAAEEQKPVPKKRISGELHESFDNVSKRIDKFQDMVKEQIEIQKASANTQQYNGSGAVRAKEENELVEEIITSAERCKRALEFDEDIREILETTYKRNKKRYKQHCAKYRCDSDSDNNI